MGVFEDLANQKTGMHWQHDRHHSMQLQANPYDPSRDLSPNLPTTSCRGLHELTNVFAAAGTGTHGHCGCAFKSEFDDDCNGPSDCCGADCNNQQQQQQQPPQQLQQHQQQQQLLHHVSPPAPVAIGGGGEHEGSSPAQALLQHPLHRHHHPHDHVLHHLHHLHHLQQPPHRGYLGRRDSSPEPPPPQPPPPSSPPGVYDGEAAAYLQQQRSPLDRAHRSAEPEEPAAEVNLCDGCGLKILDRYYLFAVDKRWHATCLQCSRCSRTLATEIKCFYRDGNIYCKSDYQRLYGARRCGRCQTAISPSELVMRARDTVFHVPCFSCAACATVLTKGDQFGMRDNAVFCQHHYRQFASAPPSPSSLQHPKRSPTPSQHHQQHQRPAAVRSALQHGAQLESPAPGFFDGPAAAAAPAQPRQKGRPRKRKPKDLDVMAATMDMNSSDSYNMEMAFGPGGLSGSGGNGGPGSGHHRTKRMRTSFKHHQLRTMKSYFHHNHNPDAKDLKQLSQKTGLPKRVLQVWFQNARAKYRRTATKQEGGLGALGPPSIKTEKSCSESSTGSTGIEAVMFHQQQQHYSMPMSPKSYLSSSSPMECGS